MEKEDPGFETVLAQEFDAIWSEIQLKLTKKEQLDALLLVDSRSKLEILIKTVKRAVEQQKERHDSKCRGLSKSVQDICASMARLLDRYSGIGEVIKGLHPQGGPLAYGILSLLLTIYREKQDRDRMISENLEKMVDSFHLLPSYQNIYEDIKTDNLTTKVINLYKAMYRLILIMCTYTSSKRDGIFKSLKPSKFDLQDEILKLKNCVDAVSDETMLLLHRRVCDLQSDMRVLQKKVDGTNRLLKENKQADWIDFISRIQHQFIGLTDFNCDPGKQLQKFKKDSAIVADEDEEIDVEEGTLQTLNNKAEFKEWRMSSESSLLLIRAINHYEAHYKAPLWLSQAVSELVIDLRKNYSKVIYHAVANNNPMTTVGAIICQIMQGNEDFYVSHKQIVENVLKDNTPKSRTLEANLELLSSLLEAWSLGRRDWTFIIIDGVDQWVSQSRNELPAEFTLMVSKLLNLLRRKSVKMKVCFLADDSNWYFPIDTYLSLLPSKEPLIDTKRWQQGEAPYF